MDIKKQLILTLLSTSVLFTQTHTFHENFQHIEEPEKEPEVVEAFLPETKDSSFKSYMDYRTITDSTSRQWQLQQEAYTDENGIRKVGDYYCVALGSGISSEIGEKFEICFDTGQIIKVILADQKADRHTDATNTFLDLGDGRINVIEFVVETEIMPEIVQVMGDISYMPNDLFEGEITEIRIIEEETTEDEEVAEEEETEFVKEDSREKAIEEEPEV